MSLEEKIEQMAKDIAELKDHLLPKSSNGECNHQYDSHVFDMKNTVPICLKCGRVYTYQGR